MVIMLQNQNYRQKKRQTIPKGNGANGVIFCIVNRQEVKRLILLLVQILVLFLRELTVI